MENKTGNRIGIRIGNKMGSKSSSSLYLFPSLFLSLVPVPFSVLFPIPLAKRLGYLDEKSHQELFDTANETARALDGYLKYKERRLRGN